MRVHYPKVLPKDGARIFISRRVIDFGEMDESENEYESLVSPRTLMSRGQLCMPTFLCSPSMISTRWKNIEQEIVPVMDGTKSNVSASSRNRFFRSLTPERHGRVQ